MFLSIGIGKNEQSRRCGTHALSQRKNQMLCGATGVSDKSGTEIYVLSLINLNASKTMSIESAIEQKIREAIARGEFDNLAGKGKPIDLEAYFNTPEDLRMAFAMLKSNSFVPEEIEIMKEITQLKADLESCSDESTRELLRTRINECSLALSLLLERRRRR